MSELLQTLMERAGITKLPPKVKNDLGFKGFVSRSADFIRISALPRRDWTADPEHVAGVIDLLTAELKTPAGEMTLQPVQAMFLHDLIIYGGAFGPIGVGRGKTLASLLAAVVSGAKRPILFVPAALRDKTINIDVPELRQHWRLNYDLRVVSYTALSQAKNADMLEDLRPDLVILDECHEVKNTKAGRTRRLVRYFNEHPEARCAAMSGTISNRSLKDFAHIIEWTHRRRSPLPLKWPELSDWADAVDELKEPEQRMAPGVLMEFCREGENVRQGFRRRLVETPGVVATADDELGTSLRVAPLEGVRIPPRIWNMLEEMRETWMTPNGDIITEAVDLWRHLRELALGFWYRWEPEPPKDWLDARREWKRYVRETLKHNRRNLDTELQVWNECAWYEKTRNEVIAAWADWRDIRDTFKINSVAEWVDDFALEYAADWLVDGGGIVWTEHRAFGHRLDDLTGRPYFGAGNSAILTTDAPGIIASIAAHGQGKNLQRYARNLITSPPSSGQTWEQLLGRTHRQGQEADEVSADVFLYTDEQQASFEQARADARYLEDTYGNRQKLNYADVVI